VNVPRRAALRGLVLLSLALPAALPAGCTLRKHYGPDFKRFSREHRFEVKQATHRAGELELSVLSGSIAEVYTAIGSESFTARVSVRLANRGSAPLAVGMDDVEAITADSGRTAVYFNAVNVPPGGSADALLSIPAGTTRRRPPVALVYRGVRMHL
jgi:hypothetical protein